MTVAELFGDTWIARITVAISLVCALLLMLDGLNRIDGSWNTGIFPNAWSAEVPREEWFAHRIQWDAEYRAELGIAGEPHDYGGEK
jgi:hypothetical protein